MGAPYSPAALRAKCDEIAEAAISSLLKQNGWFPTSDGEFIGMGWEPRLPAPDPRLQTGDMTFTYSAGSGDGRTLTGMTQIGDSDPEDGSTEWRFDPSNDLYRPWYSLIREAFEGWDEIPEAQGFDQLVDAARNAVAKMTLTSGDTQGGGDLTADGDLPSSLEYIDKWIGPSDPGAFTSQAISTFDLNYGAARLATVVGNQRQAMIAIGLALSGAQNIWLKAGEDIMELADRAKTAFTELEADSFDLGIITALAGVVELFAVGPLAPLGTELGAVTKKADEIVKGQETVQMAIDKITPKDSAEKVDPKLQGSTVGEVYENLARVIAATNTAIWSQEKALIDPLNEIFEDELRDRRGYHLQPDGIVPQFRDAKPINVKVDGLLAVVGTAIPTVVAKLASVADDLKATSPSLPWLRSGPIGYGSDGAYPEVNRLARFTSELAMSSGRLLLDADRILAGALHLLEQADAESSHILSSVTADLKDAPDVFPAPPGDPRAHSYTTPPRGRSVAS